MPCHDSQFPHFRLSRLDSFLIDHNSFDIIISVNVLHIAKTALYDNENSAGDALDIMVKQYSSKSWHYVDPRTGESPDLHHAILRRDMGGGEIQLCCHI